MRCIGQRVSLVGGLEDMEVLEMRPAKGGRALTEKLESVGTTGYMLGEQKSLGIHGKRAARNFLMLVEAVQRYA